MKVLITGGTGFIGSRLALKLLDNGHTVKVLGHQNTRAETENAQRLKKSGIEVFVGSVMDLDTVVHALTGIDLVYHLAAVQHEANVPNQVFWDVNVTGTHNILEASCNSGVKRFVHGSTIGVYGKTLEGSLNEDSFVRPDNIYGVTKLEGEKTVLSFQEKLPVVVIRISETYGPGDRRLLKLFKAIKKGVFFVIGDGKNLHQLLYIDDLIEGLLSAAIKDQAVGKVVVLAGTEPLSTTQMSSIIAKELGVTIPTWRLPFWPFLMIATLMEGVLRPLGIQPPLHRRRMDFFKKSFVLSTTRAQHILKFQPRYSFKQGVRETAKWYVETGCL